MRLFDEEGAPLNPDVPNRKSLFKQMGELIPQLKVRQDRLKREEMQVQLQRRHIANEQEKQKHKAAGGSNKKKNRKKR